MKCEASDSYPAVSILSYTQGGVLLRFRIASVLVCSREAEEIVDILLYVRCRDRENVRGH